MYTNTVTFDICSVVINICISIYCLKYNVIYTCITYCNKLSKAHSNAIKFENDSNKMHLDIIDTFTCTFVFFDKFDT